MYMHFMLYNLSHEAARRWIVSDSKCKTTCASDVSLVVKEKTWPIVWYFLYLMAHVVLWASMAELGSTPGFDSRP